VFTLYFQEKLRLSSSLYAPALLLCSACVLGACSDQATGTSGTDPVGSSETGNTAGINDGQNNGDAGSTDTGTTTTGTDSSGTTDTGDTDSGNTPTGNSDSGSATGGSPTNSMADSGEPLVLAPLPQPPLTSAPNAADEPIPVSGPVSTVTEFFLVRDPGPPLPEDTTGQLTDEDFNAGPIPVVITTPAGVNADVNRPPYFEGLENQTVFAGSTLDLVLRPRDPDGGIPGMFPESLPEGAQYIDNFDGTRTLRWRPLQPDVGIRSFTITAVDAAEPQYRVRHTILIKVVMPSDPSGIVNLAPGINEVRPHTVRVNDPVVIEIKVTDPNGTIPRLEVLNQPAGATLIPHPSEPNFSVLRFVPRTPGTITVTAVAHDALNEDSTARKDIQVNVRPGADFERDGPSLRDLATPRNFRLGYASLKDFYYRPDGAVYAFTAANEFNFVTSENSLKWSFINPLPGRYRWASADNLVSFARTKGMEVHGHTLVWHRQLPNWVKFSPVETRETHMREFIDRVLTRYADRVPVWDVVNEALEDDGTFRNSTWYEAMGERYIETAFRQARASAPNARLLYNEYDVAWNGPKSTAMFNMLQTLKDRGTPLTGVGFQMHIFAAFDAFDEVEANFQKAADMDLDIYITELDVSITDGATEQQQAEVYRRVLDICLRQPRCKGMQTWGFTDQYSWRRDFKPLLLDNEYQIKPAYSALLDRLGQN